MQRLSVPFAVSPACSEPEPDPGDPTTTTAVISPDGGTVTTTSGASVSAPPGAVDSDVEISVGTVGEDEAAISPIHR